MKKVFFLLCLLVVLCIPVHGEDTFTYREKTDGIWITGCSQSGSITVPAQIDGKPVVGIAYGAFSDRTDLTAVVLPEGLRYIAEYAFSGCSGVDLLEIPESVEWIGKGALQMVDYTGERYSWADHYSKLYGGSYFRVSGSRPGYRSVCDEAGSLFWIHEGEAELIRIGVPTDHTYVIPEMVGGCPVRAVGTACLGYDDRQIGYELYHIVIPGSVRTVEPYAFYGERSIRSIYLCEGVEAIGEHALDCSPQNLGRLGLIVTLPHSLKTFGESVFADDLSSYVSDRYTVIGYADTPAQEEARKAGVIFAPRIGAQGRRFGDYCGFSFYAEEDAVTIYSDDRSCTAFIPGQIEGIPVRTIVMSGIIRKQTVLPENAREFVLPLSEGEHRFLVYPGSEAERFCRQNGLNYGSAYTYIGVPFADAEEMKWYYEPVCYVYHTGLMNGTSETAFSPNTETTRAMVVTVLWRMAGAPAASREPYFSDVDPDRWYGQAVAWAYENNIVKGITKTQFSPNTPVTRQQLAVLLQRYCGGTGDPASLFGYADTGRVSAWAAEGMGWAVENRIITGSLQSGELYLLPDRSAKRCEIAATLMRLLTRYDQIGNE